MTVGGPLADPRVRFAMLVVLVYAISFGIIMPVLPRLVMTLSGRSLAEATTIGGALAVTYAACQFVFSPVMGALGDRFGRRPVLLIALAGLAVDYAVMAFAPSVEWLFVGRAAAGALGAVFAPSQAVIADVTPKEGRAAAFGLLGAAFGIGFVAGPALGGLIGEVSLRLPFFLAAGVAALAWVVGLMRFVETLPPERRRAFDWRRANPLGALRALRSIPGALPLGGAYFCWIAAVNIFPVAWSWFASAAYGWGPGMIGASLVVTGLSMVVFQARVIAPLTRRMGARGTIRIGLIGAMAGMGFYMVNPLGWLALVVMAVIGIQGVVQPSLTALLSGSVGDDRQGELLGLNASLAALAAIAAPFLYNPLLAYFTGADAPFRFPGAPFAVSLALALAAFVLVGRTRPAGA